MKLKIFERKLIYEQYFFIFESGMKAYFVEMK